MYWLIFLKRRFCIGGNWKMQISSVGEASKIASELSVAVNSDYLDIFIAPSYNALYTLGTELQGSRVKLAAQNMYYREKGAFTGEISVSSLIDAGVKYVLLGHSERRRIFGETDNEINLKLLKALEKGLIPVLCIGETAKEREQGKVASVNETQLSGSLKDVSSKQMKNVIIAYEPVWAINNPYLNPDTEIKPATPLQASEAHKIARNWIKNNYSNTIAEQVRIIYGGSMNASNAAELLAIEDIDGGLVGGASLSAEKFIPIIQFADEIYRKDNNINWDGNTLKFHD